MKRYSFSSFLVDDSNRHAVEVCRDIAAFKPVSPQPVVLLGDQGSGKTHLLLSIIGQVRAGAQRAGLAFINAFDFPDPVRALIDDPSPVQKHDKAILLVDQLDQFSELVEELEAVVRIFLDMNHCVVLASASHPWRLKNITEGLRDLAMKGQIVELPPHDGKKQMEVIRKQAREEAEARLEKERAELERLRSQLAEKGEQPAPTPASEQTDEGRETAAEFDGLRKRIATLEQELAETREQLQEARNALIEASSDEPDSQATDLLQLRTELDQVRRSAGDAVQEAEQRRAQVAQLESEKTSLQTEIDALKKQLEEAQQDSERARQEANGLLGRAENLLEQIDGDRERFEQNKREHQDQVTALQTLMEQQAAAGAEAHEAMNARYQTQLREVEALRHELESTASDARARIESLEADLARLQAEHETAKERLAETQAEREELATTANETLAEITTLRESHAASQARVAELEEQLATLRKEAAAQVAEAQAYAGELEGRLTRMRAERDEAQQNVNGITDELLDIQARFTATISSFGALAQQLERHVVEEQYVAPVEKSSEESTLVAGEEEQAEPESEDEELLARFSAEIAALDTQLSSDDTDRPQESEDSIWHGDDSPVEETEDVDATMPESDTSQEPDAPSGEDHISEPETETESQSDETIEWPASTVYPIDDEERNTSSNS